VDEVDLDAYHKYNIGNLPGLLPTVIDGH
jgi:hypothetical protein